MKIQKLYVKQMGELNDKLLEFSPGATLIYGPNEAGKSTILQFIRMMLFGFGHRAFDSSMTIETGASGVMVLEQEDGRLITIERTIRGNSMSASGRSSTGNETLRVTLDDGEDGGKALLQQVLGNLTPTLFRDLFAISLNELQEVRTLHSEEINGYLYSAGMGASGQAIMGAERKLTQEMELLYKPRGKTQEMNLLVKKLEQLESELKRSKEQIHIYNNKAEALSLLERDLIAAHELLKQVQREVSWNTVCLKVREPWLQMKVILAELSGYPKGSRLAEDTLSRYVSLEAERQRHLADQLRVQQRMVQVEEQLNQIVIDEAVIDQAEAIERLSEQVSSYREWQVSAAEQRKELEHQELELGRVLRHMDGSWGEEQLLRFPVSAAWKETIREEQERRRAGHLQSVRLESELAGLAAEEAKLGDGLAAAVQKRRDIAAQREALPVRWAVDESAELSSLWAELKSHAERLHAAQQLREASQLQGQRQGERASLPLAGVLRSAGIALLALGAYAFVTSGIRTAGFAFGTAGLLCLGLALAWPALRGQAGSTPAAAGRRSGGRRSLAEAAAEPCRFHEACIRELSARMFAGTPPPVEAFMGERMAPLQRAHERVVQLLQEEQQWERKIGEDTQEALALRKHIAAKEAALEAFHRMQREQDDAWSDQLITLQLPAHLQPNAVLEMTQLADQGLQYLQQRKRTQGRLDMLTQQQLTFEQTTVACIQNDRKPSESVDWIVEVKRIKEKLDHSRAKLVERQQGLARLQEHQGEIMLLQTAAEHAKEQIIQLWQEAQVTDEKQLRLRFQEQTKREQLEKELRNKEVLVNTWVEAEKEKQQALQQELEEKDLMLLHEEQQLLQSRHLELQSQITELVDQRARMRQELEHMDGDTEHGNRLQQQEELIAQLEQQWNRYGILSYCAKLISETKGYYERERQPEVLRIASDYLRIITGNRYVKLIAPIGEKRILVERETGERLESVQLSRGTAEQVYLSMRFALARQYGERLNLPLVLDDLFVNFDKTRLQHTLQAVQQVAEQHQVILFTCHDHVAEAAAKTLVPFRKINFEATRLDSAVKVTL